VTGEDTPCGPAHIPRVCIRSPIAIRVHARHRLLTDLLSLTAVPVRLPSGTEFAFREGNVGAF
jgi:hypothetical protein